MGLGLGLGAQACASSSSAAGMGPPPHAASPAARSWASALRPAGRGLDEARAAAGAPDCRCGARTAGLASNSRPPHAASERSASARNSCEVKPSRKQKPARTRQAGVFAGASMSRPPRRSGRAARWWRCASCRTPPTERVSVRTAPRIRELTRYAQDHILDYKTTPETGAMGSCAFAMGLSPSAISRPGAGSMLRTQPSSGDD